MSGVVGEESGACPRCGQPTAGAWSEGGVQWTLCEACLAAEASVDREEGLWDDGGEDEGDDDVLEVAR